MHVQITVMYLLPHERAFIISFISCPLLTAFIALLWAIRMNLSHSTSKREMHKRFFSYPLLFWEIMPTAQVCSIEEKLIAKVGRGLRNPAKKPKANEETWKGNSLKPSRVTGCEDDSPAQINQLSFLYNNARHFFFCSALSLIACQYSILHFD